MTGEAPLAERETAAIKGACDLRPSAKVPPRIGRCRRSSSGLNLPAMKLRWVALLCLPLVCRAVVSEDLLPHQAEWITLPSLDGSKIPSPPSDVSRFRRSFLSGANVAKAILLAAADGGAELWLNGNPAGRCSGVGTAVSLDVTKLLRSGTNLLAVEVKASNRPPALRLMLELVLNDGHELWN